MRQPECAAGRERFERALEERVRELEALLAVETKRADEYDQLSRDTNAAFEEASEAVEDAKAETAVVLAVAAALRADLEDARGALASARGGLATS